MSLMRSRWPSAAWGKWLAGAGLGWLLAGCARSHTVMVVNVPVVDLRGQSHTTSQPGTHDPLQETQLLYGEPVRVLKTQEGWAYVEAVEQQEFTHANRWQGYPGWMVSSALHPWEPLLAPNVVVTEKWAQAWQDAYLLRPSTWKFSLGTYLRATDMGGERWKVELLDGSVGWMPHQYAQSFRELHTLPTPSKRRAILRSAQRFLGDRYYWGGRSPQTAQANLEGPVTGVDCSGLVNLAYRAVGVDIPRDAPEQFLRARPVKTLQPADLVFLSERGNPKRVVHVMLYAGDGALIEGPGTGMAVRRIGVAERFGRPMDQLEPGAVIDGQTVSFGSYLP